MKVRLLSESTSTLNLIEVWFIKTLCVGCHVKASESSRLGSKSPHVIKIFLLNLHLEKKALLIFTATMARPKDSFCALIMIVSIAVCSGSAIVSNQDISSTKEIQKPQMELLLRKSTPVQSLPMIPLYKVNKIPGQMTDLQRMNNKGCSCQGMQCGCCIHLEEESIGLNDTGCVNVTYLSKEIGFEFTLSVDGIVLIDKKISVSNPPPLCADIPYLKKLASACVKFSDLHFQDKQLSGCIAVEIVFVGEVLVNYSLGCFHIPPTLDNKDLKFSDEKQMKMMHALYVPYMRHRLQKVEDLRYKENSLCACKGYSCGCCIHMESKRISLNETGCVNVSYLPSEIGFDFKLTLNGKIIIEDKLSVSNPPPICVAVPQLHKLASVCVIFRDLSFKGRQFSGCALISVKVADVTVEKFDLGCFHIPPNVLTLDADAPIMFKK
ncbi:hypothetical protein RRG08_028622 [Elysia crispata]|uniref:DUF4773 domain-containing protein n=1 Tax=Elysia crispata TaxID=231223 RepID=A0AAE1DKX3_9GAST|nr:hypothetical protein RRG08_028622 [Elysia crispata]